MIAVTDNLVQTWKSTHRKRTEFYCRTCSKFNRVMATAHYREMPPKRTSAGRAEKVIEKHHTTLKWNGML